MNAIPISKPLTGKEEKRAVADVLASGMLAQGEQVAQLEEEFAKFCGVKHAVACTSGTAALVMALNCLNIKGSVLVPSFTFIASVTSILAVNAKPVFVDIDPRTYCIDVEDAKKKLSPDVEAIMPVHLYGQCANMDEVRELAQKNELYIIEDAAQAHGAEWGGTKAGALGDAGCFSFYPTKNMTTGEGGMVTTNNDALAARLRVFRNHGQSSRYVHNSLGYNIRMTNIHAAIGVEQLKKLPKFNRARQKNAEYLDTHLDVDSPYVHHKAKHVYHQYTVRVQDREAYTRELAANGIGYGIYYPVGAHRQPAVASEAILPETDKACDEVISLPVHPGVKKEGLKRIVEAMNSLP
ncbi:MAG: DegT/DnrJ/EryC1/StrS family aminotransferase [Candidatus Diapherotrites archaeon]|nr:DegT/DnrJ/EryC1/StrS family aminotransferase [Candidatus Diapherotrites archaeon]